MLKKLTLALMLALPMIASAQSVKIGLVDTQSILTAMPESKTAQESIAKFAKEYEEEYGKLNEEYTKLVEEFQNLPASTSELTKKRKAGAVQDCQKRLMEFEQNAQSAIAQKQEQEMTPIISRARTAIESVGKEGNYTLIQELGSVLYFGAPAENITSAVKAKLGLQ